MTIADAALQDFGALQGWSLTFFNPVPAPGAGVATMAAFGGAAALRRRRA